MRKNEIVSKKDELINLLERYTKEYDDLKIELEECETNLILYNDLFNHLSKGTDDIIDNYIFVAILLDTIYNDNMKDDKTNKESHANILYRLLVRCDNSKKDTANYQEMLLSLKQDCTNLVDRIKHLKSKIESRTDASEAAKKTVVAISYRKELYYKNYIEVKKIITKYESGKVITPKEELLLLNELDYYYNNKRTLKGNRIDYPRTLYYAVYDVINMGFEKLDEIKIDNSRRELLNHRISKLKQDIPHVPNEKLIEELESCKYDISDSEYKFIIRDVLDWLMGDLMFYYDILKEKDIYGETENRVSVIKDYMVTFNKFLEIKNYYETITLDKKETPQSPVSQEQTKSITDKKLIFAHPKGNISKSYFEDDIDKINPENYSKIKELLERYITNSIPKKEVESLKFTEKELRGFRKLKDDQVRIVTRHVKGNVYLIMGVFIKKDQKASKEYRAIAERPKPLVNNQDLLDKYVNLGDRIVGNISVILEKNARKSTR